jgi:hypothetical protein
MPSPDSKARARAELVDLLESQLKSLQNQTFGCATEAELREYEDRHERIRRLFAELVDQEVTGEKHNSQIA